MLERKNVYVVASEHEVDFGPQASVHELYTKGPSEEAVALAETNNEAIVARQEVILHLFRTLGSVSYYSDGFSRPIALKLQEILETASDDAILDTVIETRFLGSSHLVERELFDEMFRIRQLQDEGVTVRYMHTEGGYMLPNPHLFDFDSPKDREMFVDQTREIYPFVREFSAVPTTYDCLLAVADVRDFYILSRIAETGSKENVLFIGADHKLLTVGLFKDRLDIYRIDVDLDRGEHGNEAPIATIKGELPVTLQEAFTSPEFQSEMWGKVVELDFVDRGPPPSQVVRPAARLSRYAMAGLYAALR